MITFDYQMTLADYRALNRQALWRPMRTLVVIAALSLGLFLVAPWLPLQGAADSGGLVRYRDSLGLLVLPVLVALVFVLQAFGVRKRWRAAAELSAVRTYRIDATGVRVDAPTFAGFLEWRHFASAEIRQGMYLLKTHQQQYHFFPVAAVPDQAELDRLIARHIVDTTKTQARNRRWWMFGLWLVLVVGVVVVSWLRQPQAGP